MKWVIEPPNDFRYVTVTCVNGKDVSVYTKERDELEQLKTEYIKENCADIYNTIYQLGFGNGSLFAKNDDARVALDHAHDIENVAKMNYDKGLEDAWGVARKLIDLWTNDKDDIFGSESLIEFINSHSASESITKLRDCENKKTDGEDVKVGDEVTILNCTSKYFVIRVCNGTCVVSDMKSWNGWYYIENVTKTGYHSTAVEQVVKEMEERNCQNT